MKILSLCLPTYKRKNFLDRAIKNIIEETNDIRDKVELCISDNASLDGTENIVKKYSKKYSFIRYNKNQKNIGYDKNLLKTLDMASGEYCWFISDDDIFVKGAIKRTILLLESKKYDYILSESRSVDRPLFMGWKYDPELTKSADRERLLNYREISFMATHIIKKKLYLKIKKNLFTGHGFEHMLIFFYALRDADLMYITKVPNVFYMGDGIYSTAKKHLLFFDKIFFFIDNCYSKKVITKSMKEKMIRCFYNYLVPNTLFGIVLAKNKLDIKELFSIFTDIHLKYIKNTKLDTFLIRYLLFIKNKRFFIFLSKIMFIFSYMILYVKFFNIFRKDKMPVMWEIYEKRKKLGAREAEF